MQTLDIAKPKSFRVEDRVKAPVWSGKYLNTRVGWEHGRIVEIGELWALIRLDNGFAREIAIIDLERE